MKTRHQIRFRHLLSVSKCTCFIKTDCIFYMCIIEIIFLTYLKLFFEISNQKTHIKAQCEFYTIPIKVIFIIEKLFLKIKVVNVRALKLSQNSFHCRSSFSFSKMRLFINRVKNNCFLLTVTQIILIEVMAYRQVKLDPIEPKFKITRCS